MHRVVPLAGKARGRAARYSRVSQWGSLLLHSAGVCRCLHSMRADLESRDGTRWPNMTREARTSRIDLPQRLRGNEPVAAGRDSPPTASSASGVLRCPRAGRRIRCRGRASTVLTQTYSSWCRSCCGRLQLTRMQCLEDTDQSLALDRCIRQHI